MVPTPRHDRRRPLAAALLGALLVPALGAAAGPEQELALRYAPIVRLQQQREPCGPGEPFQPTDVRRLFDNDEVALRGPWDRSNLVAIAPGEGDLSADRFGYHLDFPGDPLAPGCTYETWSRRLVRGSEPTTYARVVGEPDRPGRLALQYWLFYPYNDFNNKHEGDWEMIQLVFAAADAADALGRSPVRVGYSQHEGAEQAAWGDDKLELVDGRPVVYAAAGSHANYFEPGLFLGREAAQGVGCDDTTGPSRSVALRVDFVPTDEDAYLAAYPWLAFPGHWGEKQPGFYDGPTGPNRKAQWRAPITWSEREWRDRSFAVVGGSLLGPQATAFFCEGVRTGSDLLRALTLHPGAVALALLAVIALLLWAASRTSWQPSAPLHLERRRAAGQILAASGRLYLAHPALFVGIGLVVVPVSLLASGLHAGAGALARLVAPLGSQGESNTIAAAFALAGAIVFGLAVLGLLQVACARAMTELDGGRPVSARAAYREAIGRAPAMLGAVLRVALWIGALSLFGIGIPIAVWLAGRWVLLGQAVELEQRTGGDVLRRSAELVRGHWWRVALLATAFAAGALLPGLGVGILLLFATPAPFVLVNLLSSLIYAATLPLLAIATTYLYFDLRVRWRLAGQTPPAPAVLPAEV